MRCKTIVLLLSIGITSSLAQVSTREDGRCGPEVFALDGREAGCDYIPPFNTCCQENGHCGWDCQGAKRIVGPSNSVVTEKPTPKTTEKPTYTSNGKYRSDARCGAGFPLEDGVTPAECDPNSEFWCCSEHGYCGGTQEHCYCDTCVNYRPIKVVNKVRSDRRCGADFPLDDGTPSECDGQSENPCCSKHGYCGPGADHCTCIGCTDYTSGVAKHTEMFNGKVRGDRRCGAAFPLPDGSASECDGSGPNHCCSKWNFCGPGPDHCACPECKDYRTVEQKQEDFTGNGLVRSDRRCGREFLIPGTLDPSQCDPDSSNFCCSKWGYCGGDEEHCDCPECVNYRDLRFLEYSDY